ncbi:MAG TPA: metalloregulator ArsR/SmtB family transcription factor [Acidobacteriota bacterium]|nr:metalloregulator ArsR/SmtB family transcription factor [Acidobacteriota bacterium]
MIKDYAALSEDALDMVAARFRVLGEPMRLRLLQELTGGERTVSELVERTGATQANVSKHVSLLVQAGLVYKRREGVSIYCGIADESVFKLCGIVCGGLQKQFSSRARVMER